MGEMIEFPSNGSTAVGLPGQTTGGKGPGVIVIQEWWGLVDHIRDVCDRFAAGGIRGVGAGSVPRSDVAEPDEAAKEMMALKMDQAARDMSGAVDEVIRRSGARPHRRHRFLHGGWVGAGAGHAAAGRRLRCGALLRRHPLARCATRLLVALGRRPRATTPARTTSSRRLRPKLSGSSSGHWVRRSRSSSTRVPITPSSTTPDPRCTTPRRRRRCGTAAWRSSTRHLGLGPVGRPVGRDGPAGAGLLPFGHVCSLSRPAAPLLSLHPRIEREIPGQGTHGPGRHDLPRPRGRGGPAGEGGCPAQGRRRHQEPALGRPCAVRPGERVGHRMDLRRRHRSGGERRASVSTRSCCRRCSRRPRWWRSTSC